MTIKRRYTVLLSVLAALTSSFVAVLPAGVAQASPTVDVSMSWPMYPTANGSCIVARGGDNNAQVVKTPCDLRYLDQYWRFEVSTYPYYHLKNSNSGKCLVAQGGAYAFVFNCGPWGDQEWEILPLGDGDSFQVRQRNSGQCLVLRGNQNNALQAPCNSAYADQIWRRGMPNTPARTNDMTKPVYLVHGYNIDGSALDINGNYFYTLRNYFQYGIDSRPALSGPIGRTWTYCFYSNDVGCDQTEPFATDRQQPIENIGLNLAWDIYYRFSRYNVAVDAVGHSMGGLIISSALTGIHNHQAGYPPFLYVEDAVAVSTPFAGISPISNYLCNHTNTQCAEMTAQSAFLASLRDNPQATTGTDWTIIGASDDFLVPAGVAVPSTYVHVGHKLIYGSGQLLPNLNAHMNIINRTSGTYEYHRCDWWNSSNCTMGNSNTWPDYPGSENPGLEIKTALYFSGDR